MATANFPLVKTKKYYCFGHLSEERQDWDEDMWAWYYEMMTEDWTLCKFRQRKHFNIRRDYENGDHFGTWTEWMKFGGRELPVTMKLYIRSGRYSGACFDFGDLQVDDEALEISGNIEADEMPELLEWMFRYEDYSAGWCKMQAKNFTRKLTAIRDKMKEDVELIFEELCEDKLQVSCRFSNGEVWCERTA